jgi:hypothetical protein
VEPEDFGIAAYESPPKAIPGDGFDANVCADVYNLYVIRIKFAKRALSSLATHLPFCG